MVRRAPLIATLMTLMMLWCHSAFAQVDFQGRLASVAA
jgi:hypothetical protein